MNWFTTDISVMLKDHEWDADFYNRYKLLTY